MCHLGAHCILNLLQCICCVCVVSDVQPLHSLLRGRHSYLLMYSLTYVFTYLRTHSHSRNCLHTFVLISYILTYLPIGFHITTLFPKIISKLYDMNVCKRVGIW